MLIDGVFAIAITILVLELKIPELEDRLSVAELGRALLRQAPTFVSYLLSFSVLGVFWYRHNHLYRHYRTITGRMLALHFVQLAAAAFFPFCAGLMGRYPTNRLSVVIYTGCIVAYAWSSAGAWIVARRSGSMSEDLTEEAYLRSRRRSLTSSLIITAMFLLSVSRAFAVQETASTARSTDETAIMNLSARWQTALLDRDAATQASMFAGDGLAYHDGREPLVGPSAILEWEKNAVSQHPKAKITTETRELRIAASGDIAVQAGEGQLTNLGEHGEDHAVHKQRFLTIWKKVNGDWKVAHDMAVNTTPWQ